MKRGRRILMAAVAAAIGWSWRETRVGLGSLLEGRDGAARLIGGLFPPDLDPELLARIGDAVVETLQISLAAWGIAATLGLPLSFLIAGNAGAPGWLTVPRGYSPPGCAGCRNCCGPCLSWPPSGWPGGRSLRHRPARRRPAGQDVLRVVGGGRPRAGRGSPGHRRLPAGHRAVGDLPAGALKLFRYQEPATLIVTVLILIIAIDGLSFVFRTRLTGGVRGGR